MENRETFIAITGCSPDEVDQWFQLGDNNLDRSVEIFYNMSGIDRLNIDESNDISKNNIIPEPNQFSIPEKEGIRKPDKVKKQRLIDDEDMYEMENYNNNSVWNENFNPTTDHIKYKGNFNGAKKFSVKKNKLLIINLQIENNINSMNLNRTIWNDELIISIIENKYTFMQLYSKNKSCKQLSNLYNIFEFPSILIINPLTGSLIWKSNKTNILKEDLVSIINELDYANVNRDLYETMEDLSVKKLIEKYDKENYVIKKSDQIILKVQIGKEKLDLITSNNFDLKELAIQFSKIISEKFPDEDNFDVYYDYPQKHLINEIKDNLNDVQKINKIDYTKFRFNVKFIRG